MLVKLQLLEDLVRDDRFDEVLESALNYVIAYEKEKLQNELRICYKQVADLEEKHGMSSKSFIYRYEHDRLDDMPDFMDWWALLSLESMLNKKLEMVDKVLEEENIKEAGSVKSELPNS